MNLTTKQVQDLAVFFTSPEPGDPPRDPQALGDPLTWGPYALAVDALQHGRDPIKDVLPLLGAELQAGLWAVDPAGKPAAPDDTTWTHDALLGATFPAIKWVVDGLVVSDGLTFCGGKKKVGKSLFCLHLAWTVAAGGIFLGKRCQQGPVIYLCLEDGPRRLQSRLQKQEAPQGLPITYKTRMRPLDAGGLDDLRDLIVDKKPLLLVIDTLAAAKTGKVDEQSAGAMGDLSNALRILAQDYHVGILIVAHHGKISTGDPGFDIRGSSAQPGASDLNMGLYRNEDGCTLKGEGRDIDAFALRVALDTPSLCWGLVGDARKIAKAETEDDVLGTLRKLGEADAGALARELGRDRSRVSRLLKAYEKDGKVSSRKDDTVKQPKLLYKAVI